MVAGLFGSVVAGLAAGAPAIWIRPVGLKPGASSGFNDGGTAGTRASRRIPAASVRSSSAPVTRSPEAIKMPVTTPRTLTGKRWQRLSGPKASESCPETSLGEARAVMGSVVSTTAFRAAASSSEMVSGRFSLCRFRLARSRASPSSTTRTAADVAQGAVASAKSFMAPACEGTWRRRRSVWFKPSLTVRRVRSEVSSRVWIRAASVRPSP